MIWIASSPDAIFESEVRGGSIDGQPAGRLRLMLGTVQGSGPHVSLGPFQG